jgi:hypothetical protein
VLVWYQRGWSGTMFRPWTVKAQTSAVSRTMIVIDQIPTAIIRLG